MINVDVPHGAGAASTRIQGFHRWEAQDMKRRKVMTAIAMATFLSIAGATAASAATSSSICDVDPSTSYYSWFAHAFGYCSGGI